MSLQLFLHIKLQQSRRLGPVLLKSALPTNADDVHSSSALLASPFNMLFSNISNSSVPNFIVQNNQLSETSMTRDYPSSFRNLPPTTRNNGIRFRQANFLPITHCLIITKCSSWISPPFLLP